MTTENEATTDLFHNQNNICLRRHHALGTVGIHILYCKDHAFIDGCSVGLVFGIQFPSPHFLRNFIKLQGESTITGKLVHASVSPDRCHSNSSKSTTNIFLGLFNLSAYCVSCDRTERRLTSVGSWSNESFSVQCVTTSSLGLFNNLPSGLRKQIFFNK